MRLSRLVLLGIYVWFTGTSVSSMGGHQPESNRVVDALRNVTSDGINDRLEGLRNDILMQFGLVLQTQFENYVLENLNNTLPQHMAEIVTEFLFSDEVTSVIQNAIFTILSKPEIMTATELILKVIEENSGLGITEVIEILDHANTSSVEALVESLLNNTAVHQDLGVVLTLLESRVRETLHDNGVGHRCMNGIRIFVEGLISQQHWALQMIDAFGKPNSNLLGTMHLATWRFEGSYDECVSVTTSIGPVEHFDGKYCRSFIDIPGYTLIRFLGHLGPYRLAHITYGSCVPDTCDTTEISGMIKTLGGLLSNFNVSLPETIETECEDGRDVGTDAIIAICILVILGMFTIVGTLYDVLVIQLGIAGYFKRSQVYNSNGNVNKGDAVTDDSIIEKLEMENKLNEVNSIYYVKMIFEDKVDLSKKNDDGKICKDSLEANLVKQPMTEAATPEKQKGLKTPKFIKTPKMQQQQERSKLEKILLAYSVYTNGVKILSTEQAAGSIGAMNGIRFLSMSWVILGHTYSFALGYSRNLVPHFLDKLNQWTFLSVMNGTVAVDTFFVLSGILVAYLTLKQLQKVKGPRNMNWVLFYVHRYWRLTPPYMLLMMIGTVLLPYLTSGPLWSYHGDLPFMANCRTTWWTNLLYVNNLVKSKEICMAWSWYLSNDLQFYILCPLILLPLFYHAAAGIASCLVFLAGTMIVTGIITYQHEYPVQYFLPFAPPAKDDDREYNLYFPCYTRMGPYIVGLFTGYLLYKWRCQCRISKIVNLALWLLSVGICCAAVYGPYSYKDDHVFTVIESAVYEALHRTGWGIAVSWIVFSCACGYGGWVNQVLSWRGFIPLGRLTYCAYLVHPLVMFGFLYSRRQPTYFNDFEVIYMFLGHLVVSYGVAFVASLAFESPMMGLEKALLATRSDKKK